ncbi:hypothetical protein AVEN_232013-1 [Araneus ventricosus]|uniref:Uncharacterized protein n=1 Tax=Araneus ventricosus TaxID=182803 RepID=A0A4Y2L3U9_ARAVE|nr:hypothetical protein AVEN_232013-1 [Araneus ventricosus]
MEILKYCSAIVDSSAAERFAKPRAVGWARLIGMPPTTLFKYEPRATRGFTMPHAIGTRLLRAAVNEMVRIECTSQGTEMGNRTDVSHRTKKSHIEH